MLKQSWKWGALAALCVFAGCGGGSTDVGSGTGGGSGGGGGSSSGGTMTCYSVNAGCQTSSQYCLLSVQGSINLGGMCASLESGCTTCDCATDNAKAQWLSANPGTNNCDGTITCSQSDSAITVKCQK